MRKLLLSIVFLITCAFTYAQKNEIKDLQKAIKSGSPQDIENAIQKAESVIQGASEDFQAQFLFEKVNAYNSLFEKNIKKAESLKIATEALIALESIEKQSGKPKYTNQVAPIKMNVKAALVNGAIEKQKEEKYKMAEEMILNAYKINPADTIYLYYAAQFAIGDKNYDNAVQYLEDLKKMDFTDIKDLYFATNKKTGEEEEFTDKNMRDISVRSGDYTKSRNAKSPSKRGDVVKYIALIYLEQKQIDKAKAAFEDAKKANPNDFSLMLAETNMYIEMNDLDSFNSIFNQIKSSNTKDLDVLFDLGILAYNANDFNQSIEIYKEVLHKDPSYINAYLNLSATILDKANQLAEEMGNLGNSAADNRKYDQLKNERLKYYEESVPYLEKYLELNEFKNENIMKTLLSIYTSLDMDDKAKALKSKM